MKPFAMLPCHQTTHPQTDGYFGVCPTCGSESTLYNVERLHFFACDQHKVFWFAGENLFDCWRHEDKRIWDANERRLRAYREIEPFTPIWELADFWRRREGNQTAEEIPFLKATTVRSIRSKHSVIK